MTGYPAWYEVNSIIHSEKKPLKRLPLPWFVLPLVWLVCSITNLSSLLIPVFFSILAFNWKMTKVMGMSMLSLYRVFVGASLRLNWMNFLQASVGS